MSFELPEQDNVDDREPEEGALPTDFGAIDLYLEDDDVLHGPESWREIADTLADPVETD